jgi:hypothetical protein
VPVFGDFLTNISAGQQVAARRWFAKPRRVTEDDGSLAGRLLASDFLRTPIPVILDEDFHQPPFHDVHREFDA